MENSQKIIPQNLTTLVHFFHKKILCTSQTGFFCHQVIKICQNKSLLIFILFFKEFMIILEIHYINMQARVHSYIQAA